MFKTALTFLSPYKLYIYAGLAALVIAGIAFDRHNQYNKGKRECQTEYYEASNKALEDKAKRLQETAKETLAASTKLDKKIGHVISSKNEGVKEAYDNAVKENRPLTCDLSDSELRAYNKAIGDANGE